VVGCTRRARTREKLRATFPARRTQLIVVNDAGECRVALGTQLVDAVIVDLAAPTEDTWRSAALAREFPSAAFFGLAALHISEGSSLATAATLDLVDVLVDGVDDRVLEPVIVRESFTTRFAAALDAPPIQLGLEDPLQLEVWRYLIAHGGRPVRTSWLAARLRLTREHLSRRFGARGAPNLKRVADLVRVLAASELCRNPGHDARDVARILRFASPGHLATTAQRIAGARTASLARLRLGDLVERFAAGRSRSRGLP
jgi:transcriptional regulator GlxA family with amidase domain